MSASTGSPASRCLRLPRQLGEPHEKLVDRARALPALADRPDHERLAAPRIAGGEHFRHRRDVSARAVGIGLRIAPRVLLHPELLGYSQVLNVVTRGGLAGGGGGGSAPRGYRPRR